MRLFIAIEFNKEIKDALLKTMHEMKKAGIGGNYVPGDNLHLTLAFIGESGRVADIKDAIESVKFKPFKIKLDKMGNFGNLLWAGVSGGQGLSKVASEICKSLDAKEIDYDKKPFNPHITLIRKATNAKLSGIILPNIQMEVKEISLMKSDNKGGRMVYTRI